jgi:catechol 2,3-dioxygenase-like lactoylglutathione lyase family enzyme
MEFIGIDHFVLTVEDVETTCAFYEELGAEIVTFGDGRTAIRFGDQKINLHPVDNDIDLVAGEPTVGGGDFCLMTETPIEAVEERLRDRGVEILEGPTGQTGAVGPITSVYLRDPDDNLVEIATYDGT